MKVQFSNEKAENTSLKLDKIYSVINIDLIHKENSCFDVKVRILNEDGIVALYPIIYFTIVDNEIPNDFVYEQYDGKSFGVVPKALAIKSFWDLFFNDEDFVLDIFHKRFPEYKNKLF